MAVDLTLLASESNQGSLASAVSDSVTVAAGSHVVVIFGITREASSSTYWASGIAVSDTQGLTWTISAVAHVNNGANWDVAVGVAIAESTGAATAVTVTPGVSCYSIQLVVASASGAAGTLTGAVSATSTLSPSAALELTLGATPAAGDVSLFARFWSAGGGGSVPTLSMAEGWSQLGEVLSLGDYAGSTAVWERTGGTATVTCPDPWTAAGSVYGGAALAVIIPAAGVEIEATGSASGSASVAGTGSATASASGASSGSASVSSIGAALWLSLGGVTGTSLVSGDGAALAAASGQSTGSTISEGIGAALVSATGSSTGASVALGVSSWLASAVGVATGTSAVTAISITPSDATIIADFAGVVSFALFAGEIRTEAQFAGVVIYPEFSGTIRRR